MESSPQSVRFKYRERIWGFLLIGVLLLAAIAISFGVYWAGNRPAAWWVLFAGGLVCAVFALVTASAQADIVVDANGIGRIGLGGFGRVIRWEDVSLIKVRNVVNPRLEMSLQGTLIRNFEIHRSSSSNARGARLMTFSEVPDQMGALISSLNYYVAKFHVKIEGPLGGFENRLNSSEGGSQ